MKVLTQLRQSSHSIRSFHQRSTRGITSLAGSLSSLDEDYLGVCRMAVLDSRVFANFRHHPGYTTILEHVTEAQGTEYLRMLLAGNRASTGIDEAARNDTIGGPRTMTLSTGTQISPTTLRYLKVSNDLETLFGNLDGTDVVEIGVGYGGQCRVLDSLFELNSYTLIDLAPVLDLASEFLSRFPLRTTSRFLTMNELDSRIYDLFISNYAFTELTRDLQEAYRRKVINGTKQGYVTFNATNPPEFRSYTSDELCAAFKARIFDERPLTHPGNCIIAWGSDGRTLP